MLLIAWREIWVFCTFTSFLIVSLISFISNPDSSSGLIILITSSISSFEIINAVVPDPWILFIYFFQIAASVADIAADNPNYNKTLLARVISTLFINDKSVVISGLSKIKNHPSWVVIFVVVPFYKIPLFFKELITLISFISLFVRVISEPVIDEILF